MDYKWATGAVVAVKATVAAAELARIAAERDGLRADDIVEESRPANAPLHRCFEWDDTLAAQKYRHDQAGYIIRHIIVVEDDGAREYRAFVNVKTSVADVDRVYLPTVTALAEPEYRKQVLQGALREIESWRRRYAEYAELSKILMAVEETRREIIGLTA